MATANTSDKHGRHDWHDADYVEHWITSDATRDADRKPWLERLAKLLPFDPGAPISVLDVGAGYAMLTTEVLRAFPASHVTLHDFSAPMLDHARQRLGGDVGRTSFVVADLQDPTWTDGIEDTFDAVVSSLAIHNVRDPSAIRRIYADVHRLVKPGGCFYNIDIVTPAGPLTARALWGRERTVPQGFDLSATSLHAHLRWIEEAGFDEADCLLRFDAQAAIAGFRA